MTDSPLAQIARMLAANPPAAERELRAWLERHPDDLNASLLLGRALAMQGRTEDAVAMLESLANAHPDFAAPGFEIATVLATAGRHGDAIARLRRVVRIAPVLPGAWLALGDLLWQTQACDEADNAYAAHVASSAAAPYARDAMAALRADKAERAAELARAELAYRPTDPAAMAILGEALARQGALAEAAQMLGECTRRVPSFAAARANYATVLSRQMRYDDAVEEAAALVALAPHNLEHRLLHATNLSHAGRTAEALAAFEALLAEFPQASAAWRGYGHALRGAGRSGDAAKAYRRSIAPEPGGAEGYWCIANLKAAGFTAGEKHAMEAQLARGDLGDADRCHLEFAYATALEGERRFADAFAHFRAGNALKRSTVQFDARLVAERFRTLARTLDARFLAEREGLGDPAPDPIFIVGMPRSGSTLAEQILASHSQVEGANELPDLQDIAAERRCRDWRALGAEYLARTRRHRRTGRPRFTDKMPANFEHVGLILLMLPNAKIVDVRRHALGCCVSNWRQLYFAGNNFSYDLEELGRYYRAYVALMAHFDAVAPGRIHRLRHEDLVANPEAEIRRLLAYCGLAFEPACLAFHETGREVRTISSEQVRRPVNADGVEHWRNYEPWLEPLKAALGDLLP
ncbi:MAG TPA: sulfotransferase [Rhizomicrobium sp.]|nr:sulfotransferase [Rhizomicrobium sp.]